MPAPQLVPGTWGAVTANPTSSGRWKARVEVRYLGGGRGVHRPTRKTKAAAVAAATAWARAEAVKLGPGEESAAASTISDNSSVSQLVEAYLSDPDVQSGLSATTLRQYRSTARLHVGATIGSVPLSQLRVPAITAALRRSGPGAWRSMRAVLGGAWKWGLRNGAITLPNPIPSTPPAPAVGGRRETATADEVKGFIAAAEAYSRSGRMGPSTRGAWLQFWVPVALAVGARRSEVLDMQWEDLVRVDARGRVLDGAAWDDDAAGGSAACRVHGGKVRQTEKARLGEETRPRLIELPRFAVDALRAWREEQPPASEYVWPTSRGTAISTSSLGRTWRAVKEAAGDAAIESPHALRRTAATWVAHDAGSVETAERLLGHRGASVADRYYIAEEAVMTAAIMQARWEGDTPAAR
ncbi:MAG: tyrosine-type recombinase/integrase [Corynebacterium variabile]|uniref:tyrosine-type recombinase/integrase n=1 Tax=Corynebacterium variabile TaxID=1727 RepID=UPI003BB6F50C